MLYELLNRNRVCMLFDLDDLVIKVIDDEYLPYSLRGYVKDTDISTPNAVKESYKHISAIADWLSSRVLSLSRENAKAILNSTGMPQTTRISDRIRIALACRAMAMEDNFWIRTENECVRFSEVHVRSHRLSEKSYSIAILGNCIPATATELTSDLASIGMFPKYWLRDKGNSVYMMKTDRSGGANVRAEIYASNYILQANCKAVKYVQVEKDGRLFSKSRCIASDEVMLIRAQELLDYYAHTGIRYEFLEDFSNMVVCDYVVANTDRHNENWGYNVLSSTNEVLGLAPLYDFNQALIADEVGMDINTLVYQPTNLTMFESVERYAPNSTVSFDNVDLPEKCVQRWERVKSLKSL